MFTERNHGIGLAYGVNDVDVVRADMTSTEGARYDEASSTRVAEPTEDPDGTIPRFGVVGYRGHMKLHDREKVYREYLGPQSPEYAFRIGQWVDDHYDGSFINTGEEIKVGKVGLLSTVYPCWALCEVADGIPEPGEPWGPKEGSYKLHRGYGGFYSVGGVTKTTQTESGQPGPDVGTGMMLVTRSPNPRLQCITTSYIRAADNPEDGQTTFTVDVLVRSDDTGKMVRVPMEAQVINRDPALETDIDVYCRIEWLDREWGPYWVGCPADTTSSSSSSSSSGRV